MDTHTLELLDFDKVRTLVAARAACSLGKAAAQRIEPSLDPGEIHNRQTLTTEMVEALGAGLWPPFGGLHDIRHLARRAQKESVLEAEELAETVETLRAIGNLDVWLARVGDQFPRLGGLRQGVGEFSGLAVAIEGCLDNRGKVLDTASRRLSALRRDIARAQERIQETLRQMLRSPEVRRILRFPNFTMVGHHYVLPVAKDHRGEVQGSVLRTSASNETVYVEPTAISEQSAQLSFLRAREAKEVRRILRWLSAQVGMVADALVGTLDTMAELDLVHAQARLSIDYRMSAPQFNQEGRLVLRNARHPLARSAVSERSGRLRAGPQPLEARRRPRPQIASTGRADVARAHGSIELPAAAVVSRAPSPEPRTVTPIDVNLGLRFHILVVTGPNTGGKTVALKTVGLLALMAQAGLHVPAGEGSQFPIFDDVLTDIGDEQSLEQSLSTFSSHMGRIREILGQATLALVGLARRAGGRDRPDRRRRPGPGDPGRARPHRLPLDRHHPYRRLEDLRSIQSGAENAAVEFDDETIEAQVSALDRRHRPIECLEDRAAVAAARARGRAGGGLPGPEPSGGAPDWEVLLRLRKEAESAREAAMRGAGRGRTGPRGCSRSAWLNCRRNRKSRTRSPLLVLACSRATGWSSPGWDTTARGDWSSSTRARRRPWWRSGT